MKKRKYRKCKNCGKQIGFTTKRGKVYYDEGTVNQGFDYYCNEKCYIKWNS